MPDARVVPGRVSPVNRRLTLLSGALIATLALSSCGAVETDDYVAKVGDQTLTRDQLDLLTNSSTDGTAMRIAITNWVQVTSIGGETAPEGTRIGRRSSETHLARARADGP